MRTRAIVALLVAPAIGALGASLVAAAIWSIDLGYFISALIVAYAVTLLVGVPAFLFFLSWLPTSIWTYALAGALIGAFVAVPTVFLFSLPLTFLSVLAGAITGVMYRLIAMPTSNNRWRGP